MKRLIAISLLLCLLFSLTACGSELVHDDYLSVKPHVEQVLPDPTPTG